MLHKPHHTMGDFAWFFDGLFMRQTSWNRNLQQSSTPPCIQSHRATSHPSTPSWPLTQTAEIERPANWLQAGWFCYRRVYNKNQHISNIQHERTVLCAWPVTITAAVSAWNDSFMLSFTCDPKNYVKCFIWMICVRCLCRELTQIFILYIFLMKRF